MSAAWLSRDFHVPPKTSERVRFRLASASVDRLARKRRKRIHDEGWRRSVEPVRPALSRWSLAARARFGRGREPDHQRLQALSLLFAGDGSRDLGPRQSRRDGARARWPG